MNKSVLYSKTFWFGVLTAFAPLFPSVQSLMANSPHIVAGAWGLASIILRIVSKDKVTLIP